MAVHVVGVLDYSSRLSDVVLFIDFSLNAYADVGVRERELAKWMAGMPELVRTEALYKKKPPGGCLEGMNRRCSASATSLPRLTRLC